MKRQEKEKEKLEIYKNYNGNSLPSVQTAILLYYYNTQKKRNSSS